MALINCKTCGFPTNDLTAHGAQIRERLRALLPRGAAGDTKTDWLTGSMDIALEHHEAIERLVKAKVNGSAFALVRCVFDTMLRALWLNLCATPEQIEQASRDTLHWPKMWKMREAIWQAYFGGPCSAEEAADRDEFFQFLENTWPIMCDYTHSGSQQIARRFTDSELKPDYSDGAIAEAVHLTNIAVLLMCGMLFNHLYQREKADKTKSLLLDYAAKDYAAAIKRLAPQSGA